MVRTRTGATTENAARTGPIAGKRAASSAAAGRESSNKRKSPLSSAVVIRKTYHGQLRLLAWAMPPIPGKVAGVAYWTSMLITTSGDFTRFLKSVNDKSYSMTSGQGGRSFSVPIKSAAPRWGEQAMLVAVKRAPFATHSLAVERDALGRYSATATFVEDKRQSCPSGLGSFDACIFDLAPGEDAGSVQMVLQGLPDADGEPLLSAPVLRPRGS